VKRKARERLEEASDRLARELLSMATDPSVAESVRLSAIKDALDRGGVSAKSAVEVEVGPLKPYEQILDGLARVEAGSRAEFRRSQELSDNAENRGSLGGGRRDPSMPIEAEVFDYPRNGGIPTYRPKLPRGSTQCPIPNS
jgi:hypothetical protein